MVKLSAVASGARRSGREAILHWRALGPPSTGLMDRPGKPLPLVLALARDTTPPQLESGQVASARTRLLERTVAEAAGSWPKRGAHRRLRFKEVQPTPDSCLHA